MAKSFMLMVLIGMTNCVIYQTKAAPVATSPGVCVCVYVRVDCVLACICKCVSMCV